MNARVKLVCKGKSEVVPATHLDQPDSISTYHRLLQSLFSFVQVNWTKMINGRKGFSWKTNY